MVLIVEAGHFVTITPENKPYEINRLTGRGADLTLSECCLKHTFYLLELDKACDAQ